MELASTLAYGMQCIPIADQNKQKKKSDQNMTKISAKIAVSIFTVYPTFAAGLSKTLLSI